MSTRDTKTKPGGDATRRAEPLCAPLHCKPHTRYSRTLSGLAVWRCGGKAGKAGKAGEAGKARPRLTSRCSPSAGEIGKTERSMQRSRAVGLPRTSRALPSGGPLSARCAREEGGGTEGGAGRGDASHVAA